MNIDELQSVKSQERQSDTLQQLRASFYEDAGEFIRQLREQRDQAAAEADDPFSSPEVQRLTNEIETAERTVEDIYDRRVGKLVKMASFAAADMPTQDDGLTRREQRLFDQLVDAIEANRENVLAVLDGEDPDVPTAADDAAETTEAPTSADTDEDAGVGAADLMGDPAEAAPDLRSEEASDPPAPEPEEPPAGREESPAGEPATADDPDVSEADEPEEPPAPSDMEADGGTTTASRATTARPGAAEESASSSAGNGSAEASGAVVEQSDASCERTTLRITRDVGEIMCVDERSYDLASEDVVTLPSANAEPLIRKDAAERLD